MTRLFACAVWGCLLGAVLAGCGDSGALPKPWPAKGPLRTPSDRLTTAELDQFLKIVRAHPQQHVPEFSPLDDDPGISSVDTAAALVQASQQKFRQLFDPQRQGDLWSEDREWARILHKQQAAPSEFAALVGSVSCAVTRARLEGRTDLGQLSELAREEIKDLSAQLREIDGRRQTTREKSAARMQTLLRLSRTAALLEFVDLLRQVPQENCALVKQYAAQLKPLLPPNRTDPFAELIAWRHERGKHRDVIPAEHVRLRVGETLR